MESKQYPDSICDVVKQPKQFSWYKGSMSIASIKSNITEMKAWNKAKKVAAKVIDDFTADKRDPTHGALYYHTHEVNPSWAADENIVATIGSHKFYRKAVIAIASR